MQIALEILGATVVVVLILLGIRWVNKNIKVKTDKPEKDQ